MRTKLTAATSTAAAVNMPQPTSVTNSTLVSNLEATIAEKERLIEKLREQKHAGDVEHQEEIEQLQRTLNETRAKLEQKEKDYHEGQVSSLPSSHIACGNQCAERVKVTVIQINSRCVSRRVPHRSHVS